jgi:thioredoxin-like negative regulator of GroEL
MFKVLQRQTFKSGKFQQFSKTQFTRQGKIIKVDPTNFDKEVTESKVPVIIDCYAGRNVYLKAKIGVVHVKVIYSTTHHVVAVPIFEKVIEMTQGKLKVVKINVDEHMELIEEKFPTQNVTSIPYIIGYAKGKDLISYIGVKPEEEVIAFMKTLE